MTTSGINKVFFTI